ncbi:hypothetical protein [Streptomyces formicae]
MFHETEDIEQERLRVARRPSPQDAPPVLSTFDVTLTVPAAEYEARLRSVLDAALGIALSADFAEEDLPVAAVPAWFAEVSGPLSARAPRFARRGRERYAAVIRGGSWELQSWLHEFDPDSESRGWAWWDLTRPSDGTVRIWADTWGEPFFACDELRWLAYVAGAEDVSGPELRRVDFVEGGWGVGWSGADGSLEAEFRSRLRALAAGAVTPDEVSAWALDAMEGDSPQLRDGRIRTALDRLSGADLLEGPGQYPHGKEDFDAWVEEEEGDRPATPSP